MTVGRRAGRRVPRAEIGALVVALPALVVAVLAGGAGGAWPGGAVVAGDGERLADARTTGEAGAAAEASPPAALYRVRTGDTLGEVARLHGVPFDDLARRNGLQEPFPIVAGALLAIPEPPPAGRAAPPVDGSPEIAAVLERAAREHDVPPDLLKALTWHESRWRPDAVSPAGAIGVGQLLPSTARWVSDELVGERLDPWRVDENARLSARFLRWLLDRGDGDVAGALAAYHQGRRSVARHGWYGVTEDYVREVYELRWRFRAA